MHYREVTGHPVDADVQEAAENKPEQKKDGDQVEVQVRLRGP
jgi:hypothetical protein